NKGSRYNNLFLWADNPYPAATAVNGAGDLDGFWSDCLANSLAWRLLADKTLGATMYRCIGGISSFGGDADFANEESTTSISGYFVDCEARGNTTGYAYYSGSYAFGGCAGTGCIITSEAVFIRCVGGIKSFAMGKECAGLFVDCTSGATSFGGTISADSADQGSFTGMAIRCVANEDVSGTYPNASFGGTATEGYGGNSGTLIDCVCHDMVLPMRVTGAIIDRCSFEVRSNNKDCITLLDGNSTITDSTILVYEGGDGVAINAGEAFNVCAAGNRYNNKATGTATGLGTNVTNTAPFNGPEQDASQAALVANNLDHLMKTACASNTLTNAVADYSAMAFLLAIGADISRYSATTESLEALRNHGDSAWTGAAISGSSTVGALTTTGCTAYQHARLGPFTFTAPDDTAQTGDSHSFIVYNPMDPDTVVFELNTAGSDMTISGDSDEIVTVLQATDPDENTATAGTWNYILRNTTDDTAIADGSLVIEPRPDVTFVE
ncbi:MAG: hypothetical protein HQ581_11850, partial [Planctomycetes bacterium]|nr:hypothetical protein [Planctomycetota bacterium]